MHYRLIIIKFLNMKLLFTGFYLLVATLLSAQSNPPKDWFHSDPATSQMPGINTEKAYEQLQGKPNQTVVVAIIDSGVDPEHEDLKDVMWTNEDEIPGNGIDDDKNGYIDDIHGWNFLGNKNGENLAHDNLEMTRLYVQFKKKYAGKNPSSLTAVEKQEYKMLKEYEEKINSERASNKENVEIYGTAVLALAALKEAIKKPEEDITLQDVEKQSKSDNQLISWIASLLTSYMGQGTSFKAIAHDFTELYEYHHSKYYYHYNPEYDGREIVGDKTNDPYDAQYGNANVKGPDADHGTSCAGIVAANRNNNLGLKGIADNVRIMAIRTVPDGDERDKDVANAIRYAVDNGASVVNMSFGKGQSPDKVVVDEAVQYALKNDVLLVHAAGNEGQENTPMNNFPNDHFQKKGLFKPKRAENWIEVGALNWSMGKDMVASFSNFSNENVDLFAPGVAIYSATPDNGYDSVDGTSFAGPVVAGVAALLRSYFPDLSAVQVKDIIMNSSKKIYEEVQKPGEEDLSVSFNKLSVSGGITDVSAAVKLASSTKGKKKDKAGPSQKNNGPQANNKAKKQGAGPRV